MASYICQSCRNSMRAMKLPIRTFATSSARKANDPATALADIISPTKAPRPPTEPISSATSTTPLDSSNPFLFPTGDDIPNDTNPRRPASSSTSRTPSRSSAADSAELIAQLRGMNAKQSTASAARQQATARRSAIEAQMSRSWRDGDVYAPHDLSPVEQMKAKAAKAPARARDMRPVNTRKGGGKDVIDDLNIDPLKEYKNFKMMSEFVTEMGRIRHARDTGFRGVNQRKMAKAVRRAHGLGLLPSVHRHPELMREREEERKNM